MSLELGVGGCDCSICSVQACGLGWLESVIFYLIGSMTNVSCSGSTMNVCITLLVVLSRA